MNSKEINEFTGGYVDNWVNRTEHELIAMVAEKLGLSKDTLKEKVADEKMVRRYSKDLTYWQILSIATVLKYQLTK